MLGKGVESSYQVEPMKAEDLVLVTVGYKVVAVAKATGQQVWETELVSRFFKPMAPFVTLLIDESGVYAHTDEQLFCLDLLTGNILWKTPLASGKWIKASGVASIATLGAKSNEALVAQTRSYRRNNSDSGGE